MRCIRTSERLVQLSEGVFVYETFEARSLAAIYKYAFFGALIFVLGTITVSATSFLLIFTQ